MRVIRRTARVDDLKQVAERVIGARDAMELFADVPTSDRALVASDELLERVEQRLALHIVAFGAHPGVARGDGRNGERPGTEASGRRSRADPRLFASAGNQVTADRGSGRGAFSANRRLREIDKQKDEFLSHISHEVRTPMASIRSSATSC